MKQARVGDYNWETVTGMTDKYNIFPHKAADNNGDASGHLNGTNSTNGANGANSTNSTNGTNGMNGASPNGHGPNGKSNNGNGTRSNPLAGIYNLNGRNGGTNELNRSTGGDQPKEVPLRNTDQLHDRLPTTNQAETGKLNPAALQSNANPGGHGQKVLSGSLSAFSPSSLLSLLNIQKQTGWLRLYNSTFEGYIYIDKGEVYDAEVGRISSGALAVFQLFGWKQGEFTFEVGAPSPKRRTIEASLPVLQVRATLWLDSMSKYSPFIPSPNHRVSIAAEPRSEVVIEAHQWAVLTKIVSRSLSIAELAAELGQDLMTVTRIASELVKMGVAVVLPPENQ